MNLNNKKVVAKIASMTPTQRKNFKNYVSLLLNQFAREVTDPKQKDAIKESRNLINRNL